VVYDLDERRDFPLERSFYVVGASRRKLASDRVELNRDPNLYESYLARHGEMPHPEDVAACQYRAGSGGVERRIAPIDYPSQITREVR